MTRKILLASLLLPMLVMGQARLLRHPSYSKGKIAFSYLGDIWTVNEDGTGVTRITDHKAREIYPRFSPDGQWIAFSSNREGNYDVYVIPATGGKAKQLTFHSADDNVVGWTPDGNAESGLRRTFRHPSAMGTMPEVRKTLPRFYFFTMANGFPVGAIRGAAVWTGAEPDCDGETLWTFNR